MRIFRLPPDPYLNLAVGVFDLVLLIFLDLQYGRTTSHSKSFRIWLFITTVAAFADAGLAVLSGGLLFLPYINSLIFWGSFALVELSVAAMVVYLYTYRKSAEGIRANIILSLGCIVAVIITFDMLYGKGQFVTAFCSFYIYICFLAVESRDYRQISILKERVDKENKEASYEISEKERIFSDVSDKISVPLHLIRVDATHMEQVSKRSQTKEYARQILASEEMLSFLIRDIFDMVSLNGQSLKLNNRRFHLSGLLNEIRNMMGTMAEESGLMFETTVSQGTPDVWIGDDDRIKQIVINLAANAIKYTSEGAVKIYASVDDNMNLVIDVSDTGIGIKEEDIPYLFERYHRFDSDVTKHIQGTGLGLSIVSSLVERMKGTIDVKSVYGKGSSFIVKLPLKIGGRITLRRGSILDTKAGLSYFADDLGDYRTALEICLDYASHIEDELRDLDRKTASEVYEVCHPLAYLALNIGAMELADRAFKTQREVTRKSGIEEIVPVFDETVYTIREYIESIRYV